MDRGDPVGPVAGRTSRTPIDVARVIERAPHPQLRRLRGNGRAGDPEAAAGLLLPVVAARATAAFGKALVQVITDCQLAGVSTRRADKLAKQLGLDGTSKSQVSELAKSLDEIVEGWRQVLL